jgi:hypothetical protein
MAAAGHLQQAAEANPKAAAADDDYKKTDAAEANAIATATDDATTKQMQRKLMP